MQTRNNDVQANNNNAQTNNNGMKNDFKKFAIAAGIRAVRTVCQTAVATIGTAALLTEVNWLAVLSASALSGILSLLTSVVTGLPEVK